MYIEALSGIQTAAGNFFGEINRILTWALFFGIIRR
jgi:hypothetical protein